MNTDRFNQPLFGEGEDHQQWESRICSDCRSPFLADTNDPDCFRCPQCWEKMRHEDMVQHAFQLGQYIRSQDKQTYDDLVELLRAATDPDEILRLWNAIEHIKNKHGGHKPE